MESTPNIKDDIVTINEALKRLGNQAPARQSFHAAVMKGKIHKAPDHPDAADGKIRVSWKSVLAHIAAGGFKTCGKAEREACNAAGIPTEVVITPASISAVTHRLDSLGGPDIAEPDTAVVTVNTEAEPDDKPVKDSPPPWLPTTTAKLGGKDNPKPLATPSVPVAPVKKAEGIDKKGRRTPPLRVLKNSLRHLDFEQTKAIRDWADNRLFIALTSPGAALTPTAPQTKNIKSP